MGPSALISSVCLKITDMFFFACTRPCTRYLGDSDGRGRRSPCPQDSHQRIDVCVTRVVLSSDRSPAQSSEPFRATARGAGNNVWERKVPELRHGWRLELQPRGRAVAGAEGNGKMGRCRGFANAGGWGDPPLTHVCVTVPFASLHRHRYRPPWTGLRKPCICPCWSCQELGLGRWWWLW